jgi:uncharacterized protein with PIN domain
VVQKDAELKAQMMAQAEAAIEALLAKRAKKDELDLSDIEHLVREAGQQVMQEMTNDLADAEAAKEEEAKCPECGQRLRYKGKRKRKLVTETGEVSLERRYYYCPTCRKGFFPPRPSVESEPNGL